MKALLLAFFSPSRELQELMNTLKWRLLFQLLKNFSRQPTQNVSRVPLLCLWNSLIPIFHIFFSGLVVKKLPSSSVSPSGSLQLKTVPTLPLHEAPDNAYQHIRDLEKQVALSEGKLQESQRCFDSVISSLASHIESTVSCVSDLKSSME
ncbi:hypothetical protein TNCV_3452091 [Trichonephila clavipes]|nr:hypothetical protein TNCV_3452091 [Trichonephila clavipes]